MLKFTVKQNKSSFFGFKTTNQLIYLDNKCSKMFILFKN